MEMKTTSENGTKIKLWLEGRRIKGAIGEVAEDREIREVEAQGYDCISFGTAKINGKESRIVTKINDDISNFLVKAKEEIEKLEEQERQKEVIFEVVKTKNSGMTPNWLVLDRKEKMLSDEQRKQIRKLRTVLGETALFAGATKHIDVDDLPVEEGEEYTLSEIIEICEENSEKWQQNMKEEQEKEEAYQEALEEARKTGKNVKINQYTVHCNDSSKECNTDIVNVYVTPSGRKKEERTHTY